jgi:acyl-CoA hydrolase
MASSTYWADNYLERRRSVDEAVSLIKSGQRVFVGSSCGEPQCLVRGLAEASCRFTDLEIVRLLSLKARP